jgi:hypothetical protein
MRWRDIRFEKPTEADGDAFGEVLVYRFNRTKTGCPWDCVSDNGDFWCPLCELPDPPDRIPDPPEGWRFVDSSDVDRRDVQWWDLGAKEWKDCGAWSAGFPFDKDRAYIVPIDPPKPPKPQYRPFANAAEFEPYRDRWVRRKEGMFCKVASYENYGATMGTCATIWKYSDLFDEWEFDDGTPFGVKVEP